ncbi:hypothetical protein C0995_001466 [Termitomyces sp. Mi166|nr:hypothetical protein C0995_001466 [Termitomyces sp. Mi166\
MATTTTFQHPVGPTTGSYTPPSHLEALPSHPLDRGRPQEVPRNHRGSTNTTFVDSCTPPYTLSVVTIYHSSSLLFPLCSRGGSLVGSRAHGMTTPYPAPGVSTPPLLREPLPAISSDPWMRLRPLRHHRGSTNMMTFVDSRRRYYTHFHSSCHPLPRSPPPPQPFKARLLTYKATPRTTNSQHRAHSATGSYMLPPHLEALPSIPFDCGRPLRLSTLSPRAFEHDMMFGDSPHTIRANAIRRPLTSQSAPPPVPTHPHPVMKPLPRNCSTAAGPASARSLSRGHELCVRGLARSLLRRRLTREPAGPCHEDLFAVLSPSQALPPTPFDHGRLFRMSRHYRDVRSPWPSQYSQHPSLSSSTHGICEHAHDASITRHFTTSRTFIFVASACMPSLSYLRSFLPCRPTIPASQPIPPWLYHLSLLAPLRRSSAGDSATSFTVSLERSLFMDSRAVLTYSIRFRLALRPSSRPWSLARKLMSPRHYDSLQHYSRPAPSCYTLSPPAEVIPSHPFDSGRPQRPSCYHRIHHPR